MCSNRSEEFELFFDYIKLEVVQNFLYLVVNVSCNRKLFSSSETFIGAGVQSITVEFQWLERLWTQGNLF